MPVPLCSNCRYYSPRDLTRSRSIFSIDSALCTNPECVSPVDGTGEPCQRIRWNIQSPCGYEGKLFVHKDDPDPLGDAVPTT